MSQRSRNNKKGVSLVQSLDWVSIFIYLVLLALGWMSICGASYDFEQGNNFFDFSTRSGMQIVWIATSLLLGSCILMTDDRVYETFSVAIYIGFIILLFITPYFAPDIKGSSSWLKIGPFSIQPAEFAKFGTALCVAKIMSVYGFNAGRWKDLLLASALILLPMFLIVMQRETGSALVYTAFFLMLYRHGMPGSILFAAFAAVIYFVVGVRYADVPIIASMKSGEWDRALMIGEGDASIGMLSVFSLIQLFSAGMVWVYIQQKKEMWNIILYGIVLTVIPILFSCYVYPLPLKWILPFSCAVMFFYLIWQALRQRIARFFYIGLFALGSMAFYYSTNFVLNNVLELHQRTRINVLLGLEDDPKGASWNVNQAKIAIGSGGLKGQGFTKGTQTKLKYVPEQDTDFIFCTVGEEQGFLGCTVVLVLFLVLILRLIYLAERQPYVFGRVYGYCVMSVFLFHVFINVGMVLGLTPVIGIPLPFFSYGGSSLWGFTILLFIFLRIDAGRTRSMRHRST